MQNDSTPKRVDTADTSLPSDEAANAQVQQMLEGFESDRSREAIDTHHAVGAAKKSEILHKH